MAMPIALSMIPMLNLREGKSMEKNEIKKIAADMKVELTDEDVEQIAGGYSKENWEKMTPQERVAAYNESKAKRKVDGNAYCAFYDANA